MSVKPEPNSSTQSSFIGSSCPNVVDLEHLQGG
jgi:hypothetical protein